MSIGTIPLFNLFLAFPPLLIVIYLFYRWALDWKELIYATFRMLVQLLGIGYLLSFIFKENNPLWTFTVITVMLLIAAWISLRSFKVHRKKLFLVALISLSLGSLSALLWTTFLVLPGDTWSDPKFLIPLGGMLISNSMNSLGVAVERFYSELPEHGYEHARRKAFMASLIREVNMYFAVGLVSLPGFLTGQILSGVEPLIAARYQIVIMTMVMSACAYSLAIFLVFIKRVQPEINHK